MTEALPTPSPIVAQLQRQVEELTWYLAQTRHACDCLLMAMTGGQLRAIPWEDMDPQHVGDGSSVPTPDEPPQRKIETPGAPHVPNRAQRRQAARDFVKRASNGGPR